MPTEKRRKGDLGEKLAEEYLKRKGYSIVGKNYRKRGGEIDIIATDRGQFVFVEVKARTTENFGSPAEAVTSRKLEKIENTARAYLLEKGKSVDDFRIDVVGIEIDMAEKRARIRHFKAVTRD